MQVANLFPVLRRGDEHLRNNTAAVKAVGHCDCCMGKKKRVPFDVENVGFVEREWISIYFEAKFTRGYTRVRESEFGGDELSFRREMRTRRVVLQQERRRLEHSSVIGCRAKDNTQIYNSRFVKLKKNCSVGGVPIQCRLNSAAALCRASEIAWHNWHHIYYYN